jgi:hypothetical protein
MKYGQMAEEEMGRRPGGRRGRGRPRQGTEQRTTTEQRQRIRAWFAGRLPEEWGVGPADVAVDDDEVLVTVTLAPVALPDDATAAERETAAGARVAGFREETRERRMQVAAEAQAQFDRVVSGGASSGSTTYAFTTASVPVMTRLRIGERQVLDTLIDAGVARSRSEALAWCVRLVATNEDHWISDLRSAFEHVEEVRSRGPASRSTDS